jgi:putative SOS response-associated peptidase YedK
MCGRYAASRRPEDLVEEFEVAAPPDAVLPPSYNIAPTDPVYAVLERAPRDDPGAPALRQLRTLRWGLVPSWAKDPSIASTIINARIETVTEKPAFRKAFAQRRCLLPADGYFEWYGEQRGRKQPFFIRPRDGGCSPWQASTSSGATRRDRQTSRRNGSRPARSSRRRQSTTSAASTTACR